ncbi:MAG: efflux RND transporter periplasmic adaptor subunit [Proteobacteria bacterium]|nr:efflux RND transporter periplasmic adaptor subunit [Pseudomonadota bacterium]
MEATATNGFLQTRRGRWLLIAALAFVLIGVLWWAYWFFHARFYQDTDDAYVAGDLVNVTSQISGTVVSIGADETDFVQAGQELVRLDSSDAEIALRDSEARLARAVRQTRTVFANRDQLEAVVAQRRADLSKAQSDLDRRKDLAKTGAVSAEELSHARDTLSAARDGLVAAEKNLAASAALTGQTGVPDNPEVRAAATDVERAYLVLRRTSIHAPVSGYVARRAVQLGERVSPGGQPLLSVVPLERLRVEANFKEVQLSQMRIGQPVQIVADLYGGQVEFHGTVAGLGLGTGAAFALLPAQNATGNWIKVVQRVPVRIALEPQELAAHPLRVGLSTKVHVDVRDVSGAILAQAPRQTPVLATSVYDVDRSEILARISHIIEENTVEGSRRFAAERH